MKFGGKLGKGCWSCLISLAHSSGVLVAEYTASLGLKVDASVKCESVKSQTEFKGLMIALALDGVVLELLQRMKVQGVQ